MAAGFAFGFTAGFVGLAPFDVIVAEVLVTDFLLAVEIGFAAAAFCGFAALACAAGFFLADGGLGRADWRIVGLRLAEVGDVLVTAVLMAF